MDLSSQVMKGLLSDPKYLPSCMEWGTDEADTLFQSRKEAPGYDRNEEVPLISSAFTQLAADGLTSPLIVVEIGAGVSNKTVTLLQILTASSDQEILYIPVDLDPGILSLPESLNATLSRPVTVIPLLKDVMEALDDVEKIRNEKGWPIVFGMFGPTTIVLPFQSTLDLTKRIGDILNDGRDLGFMFSYRMDVDVAVGMTNACFLESVLPNYTNRYMNLFLEQLIQSHQCTLDTSAFKPETEFKRRVPVLGDSTVDAFCFYAASREDQSFSIGKSKTQIHLKQGERISLFNGCGLRLHFSEDVVHNLAARCNLVVKSSWKTDTLGLALLTTPS